MSEGEKCVSFDGDADRIVYFYKNSGASNLHGVMVLMGIKGFQL